MVHLFTHELQTPLSYIYLPLKTGFRFSPNALSASTQSSLPTTLSIMAFSDFSPGSFSACIVALTATGPPSQISSLSRIASTRTFRRAIPRKLNSSIPGSSGWMSTILFAIPMEMASGAVTRRPVRMMSRARDTPMRAERRCVPPAAGIIPRPVSGSAM